MISHRVSHEAREVVDSYNRDHYRRWSVCEERRVVEADDARRAMIERRLRERREKE